MVLPPPISSNASIPAFGTPLSQLPSVAHKPPSNASPVHCVRLERNVSSRTSSAFLIPLDRDRCSHRICTGHCRTQRAVPQRGPSPSRWPARTGCNSRSGPSHPGQTLPRRLRSRLTRAQSGIVCSLLGGWSMSSNSAPFTASVSCPMDDWSRESAGDN